MGRISENVRVPVSEVDQLPATLGSEEGFGQPDEAPKPYNKAVTRPKEPGHRHQEDASVRGAGRTDNQGWGR